MNGRLEVVCFTKGSTKFLRLGCSAFGMTNKGIIVDKTAQEGLQFAVVLVVRHEPYAHPCLVLCGLSDETLGRREIRGPDAALPKSLTNHFPSSCQWRIRIQYKTDGSAGACHHSGFHTQEQAVNVTRLGELRERLRPWLGVVINPVTTKKMDDGVLVVFAFNVESRSFQ